MVLRTLEQKIEALFEGVFGRAFRTNVQPVELARTRARRDDGLQAANADRAADGGGLPGGARNGAGDRSADRERRAPRGGQAARRDRTLEGVRRPDPRPEHVAPPRGAPPGGRDLLDRRPRLDERHRGERAARQAGEAVERGQGQARLDGGRLQPGAPVTVASVAIEEVLLILKIAFLVLLYLFIWRIVSTASRDVRLPQESFVLAPSSPAAQQLAAAAAQSSPGRLTVLKSPSAEEG